MPMPSPSRSHTARPRFCPGWFRHRHKMRYRDVYGGVYGIAVVAQIGECDCGEREGRITEAGYQTIGWIMDLSTETELPHTFESAKFMVLHGRSYELLEV